MSLNLQVLYFATMREERGCTEEQLVTTAQNPEELYAELATRHKFSLDQRAMKVVVNDEFCEWTQPLVDGDTIAFVPPVAGG